MNEKSFDFCSIVGGYVTDYTNNPREFLARACDKYEKVSEKFKVRNLKVRDEIEI